MVRLKDLIKRYGAIIGLIAGTLCVSALGAGVYSQGQDMIDLKREYGLLRIEADLLAGRVHRAEKDSALSKQMCAHLYEHNHRHE